MSDFFASSFTFLEASLVQAETRDETDLFTNPGGTIVESLPKGAILNVVREASSFLEVETPNTSGFVARESVNLIYECKIKLVNSPEAQVPRP
jgi:hypothetical protein